MNAVLAVVRAELAKIMSKRRTFVLAGLYWLLMPVVLLLVGRVIQSNLSGPLLGESGVPGAGILAAVASPFGMARLALVGPAYMNPSFFMIIVGLYAALLIGEERSHNMWKTVLAAQPNRLAVYAGKFVTAWLALAVLIAGGLLSNTLFGLLGMTFLQTDASGEWLKLLQLGGLQILFGAAPIAFAFLVVFVLRNAALGLVTIFFLPSLLEGLYGLYATIIGFRSTGGLNVIFQALNLRNVLEDLPRYFFTANLYAPSRQLFTDVLATLGLTGGGQPLQGILGRSVTLPGAALVTAGYFLVFAVIGFFIFARRDVS